MSDRNAGSIGGDDGWTPVKRLRTHEHVLAAVEQQILSGRLKPGDRLPGERELGELLGVSRPSVREALRALESLGVITAGVGSGKRAGSKIASEPSIALSYFLRVHVGLANFRFADVLDTRLALERAAARGAARNASASDLRRLRESLDTMSDPALSSEQFHDADAAFHVALAEASGNQMLSDFTQAVRGAVRQQMVEASAAVEDWGGVVTELNAGHRQILEAVEAGDEDAAEQAVVRHITGFYDRAGFSVEA